MILDEIAEYTSLRVEKEEAIVSLAEMKKQAQSLNSATSFPFEKALSKKGLSFICEVKKASPSKGIIAENFDYLSIAKQYENAGASAISVLTEPKYFMGSDRYLREISEEVSIPTLRKDFVVSEYQIYQAKILGASAILLISALHTTEKLKYYLDIAHSLGLSALVESHNEEELEKALSCGAKIIGVNNRNLKNFVVSLDTTFRLKKLIPNDCIMVSESGIKDVNDIRQLKEVGVDGVLIGETLMKSNNIAQSLQELNT